jgi:hypothetical protein
VRGMDSLTAGSRLVSDQPVVLAVASYPSRATAEVDFQAVSALKRQGGVGHVAAAVVEKGANGCLEMVRHHSTAMPLGFGVALLGSAITVVAAPLGITFLASLLATSAEWAGAARIIGRFWHEVPRDLLRRMGNLLEAGQTGLVVVAVDHRADFISPNLSHATTKIVTDCVPADLEADFARPITPAQQQATPPPATIDDARRRPRRL